MEEKALFRRKAKKVRARVELLVHPKARKRLSNLVDHAVERTSYVILDFVVCQLENREEAILYGSLLNEADRFFKANHRPNVSFLDTLQHFSPFTEMGWPFNIPTEKRCYLENS